MNHNPSLPDRGIPLLPGAFCIAFLLSLFVLSARAEDTPFTFPSNWGGTGLMEIPTARVIRENSYRLGFSQIKPYRHYYGTISPFRGLEVGLRIMEVREVPAFDPQSGDFRDKAFDLKYQFLPEGKYVPAMAVGFMDPHGTRLYPSQYLAVSKQIYPFDITVGFGNGRFGKRPLPEKDEGIELEMFSDPEEWFRDSQFFGGIQFAPSDDFALMIEYSPVHYHRQVRDPARDIFFQGPVASRYNFGFRYKPFKSVEVDVSYQRGHEIGINLSFAYDIGNPLVPLYDPLPGERLLSAEGPLAETLTNALLIAGFSDILVITGGDALWITAQNDRYYYSTRAAGIILKSLRSLPEYIKKVHIVLTENGIAHYELITSREDIAGFVSGELTVSEFLSLSQINTGIAGDKNVKGRHTRVFRYGIKPSFETFLNDPSGFFKYRLGVSGWLGYYPWKGGTFIAGIEGYPVNNISSVNEPLSLPVRSDIVLYKRERVALGRLMFDQIYKSPRELYGKISAGYLEIQYAGLDGEIAKPIIDGRILIGLSGSIVKKRDPEHPFSFSSDDAEDFYSTAFINARLNIPEINISLDMKAGRFLAGDEGVRFTVLKFIHGVILRAWYTVTDTSDFTDEFNKGYHDKGISITIPLRLFIGADSRTAYTYTLTPWTRDPGQDIAHYETLFDFIGRNTRIYINKDREMINR